MCLSSSKNQELVKRWHKEHEQIVELAHKVIEEYSAQNKGAAKKELIELSWITIEHLMEEDIELYELLEDEGRWDDETKKLVHDFKDSFNSTKLALLDFFHKYTRKKAVLDEVFFTTFNELVSVLGERIAFESDNLYVKLNSK